MKSIQHKKLKKCIQNKLKKSWTEMNEIEKNSVKQ
jgi:hypothetical protein